MATGESIATLHTDFWEWLWSKPPQAAKAPFQQPGNKPGKASNPPPLDVSLKDEDLAEARRQIRKIARTLVTKMAAQRKRTKKHKQLDFRKTMRKSISTGGIPIELKWKAKPVKKSRLLVVLDTSGSMTKYDIMLLQIIQAIRLELSNFELFIFADNLEYVTEDIEKDWRDTVANLKKRREWHGGTDIRNSLQSLYERHNKLLTINTTILMLSDMESFEVNKAATIAHDINRKVKHFYLFNVNKPSMFHSNEYYNAYYQEYVQPFEGAVDKIFNTSTLEDMAQAVQKVCLK
jgi:uncharacterized protein with von Willebrand factor type A (vWA) domain